MNKNKLVTVLCFMSLSIGGCSKNSLNRLLGNSHEEHLGNQGQSVSIVGSNVSLYTKGDQSRFTPGTTIVFGIKNAGPGTIGLQSNASFLIVNKNTGKTVYTPPSVEVSKNIESGESQEFTWNQLDDKEQQVPEGNYSLIIYFMNEGYSSTVVKQITIGGDFLSHISWGAVVSQKEFSLGESVTFGIKNMGTVEADLPYPFHYIIENIDSGEVVLDKTENIQSVNAKASLLRLSITPGECFNTLWNQNDTQGLQVSAGRYRATFIVSKSEAPEFNNPSIEFSISLNGFYR